MQYNISWIVYDNLFFSGIRIYDAAHRYVVAPQKFKNAAAIWYEYSCAGDIENQVPAGPGKGDVFHGASKGDE